MAHLAVKKSLQFATESKLQSIVRAHEGMRPARVYLTAGELYDSSINRSPTAYELNPAEERALYDDNVDKEFTQLVILSADDDTPIGVVNWFAVHGVSMLNTNDLISSDNKGWASVMFEKSMNPESSLVGEVREPRIVPIRDDVLHDSLLRGAFRRRLRFLQPRRCQPKPQRRLLPGS